MNFDEYQKEIITYDTAKQSSSLCDPAFLEKVLGLAGEAGEVSEKFKKVIRDKSSQIDSTDKKEIAKELGDCLWYLATIARYLDIPFSEIAKGNIKKLESRQSRGRLRGSGDNR